ncbi:MAG: hypothetical protein FWG81_05980, partial [Betaproteobacteria bacterium]|nr:hypothetical protein [Betaproteobacteria bacterium]
MVTSTSKLTLMMNKVWFIRWFMCLVFALHMSPALLAAELQVGDGVVVKFGPDSRLVVRDRLLPSKSVVLTSRNDDTVGGQLQSQPRNPAVGDWAGVRFEKSMEALNVSLKDWQLRYAGAPLQMSAAALVIRGKSPVIQGLKIRDSLVGLQLTGGANPVVTGSGFLGNTVGVQVNGNSAPIFSDTQFVGNIQWAVENRTPATVVAATGNWWGDASGPRDEIDNPHGLGDPVTSGVNYGSYLTSPPQSNAGDNSPHSAITGWYSATYRQLSGNPNHVFATAQECMEETLSAWHVRYGSYPLCIMEIWVRASETQYNYAYSNCGGSGSSSCIAILECPVGTTLRGTVCEAPCAAGEERNPVSGQCEAPAQGCSVAAPVISQPVNGLVTVESSLTVAGSASIDSNVQILLNGQPYGAMVSVGEDGSFSLEVALENGANSIQAHAVKDCGSSSLSNTVNVQKNVPIAVPVGPTGLSAQSLAAGKIRLNWSRSADATVTGQRIYRADHDFSEIGEASMVANLNATATSFDNIPPADGSWTYRVVAVNAAGGISIPSNSATAVSDATLPKALSIIYESQGKFDAATERFGQGLINLTMTVNKVLSSVPYLAIVPENGLPIVVELVRMDDLHYSGSFVVDENTPSGVANAIFSARDMLDNRGTEIAVGGALKLDTEGPILSNITLNPEPPIKNDTAQALQVTFSFNKPPATTPNINYLLSKTGHMPVALGGLAKIDATTYSVTFTLPSSAGSGQPEILSFSQQTQDDLDNVSTSVLAFNHFQVYQGDLPPLDVPFALSAKAMPGGKVNLSWQTVVDADSYQIYRQSPEQNALEELAQFSGTEYIDQTPFDGLYRYAVASIRRANGEESRSAQSVVVEVETRADAPGAPQNLTLTLTGQGIYAAWQPPLASQVSYYNLYRASGLSINSIEGLTPIKTRVGSTQVYDTNPSPAASAYVVTAVDSVGNESAISNSAYLNASLLPVRNLRVELIDDMLPVISWQAPNSNVAGYVIDIGAESEKIRITPDPIKATSLTDSGYTTGERHYTIASVDAYSEEMPRSILLPNVTSQIISGLPLKRGIMNKLQIQVSNTSESSLAGMRAVVRLPTDKDGKVFKDHKSEVITLLANETRLIPVIVGGYADLPSAPQMEVGIEISPNDGELVKIARWHTVDVIDDLLFVRILPFEFTRRSTGKLKLMVENTSEVEVELLTATSTGRNASNEMRFKVLDADGNIQALQPYHQVFGAGVITLANG